MESEALSETSLVVVTLAVLSTGEVAAVAEVVPEEVGIGEAAVAGVQTCALQRSPAAMAQEGSVELSMDQLSPASVGRGSDTVTLRAVPAPELEIGKRRVGKERGGRGGSSEVLAMAMAAPRT